MMAELQADFRYLRRYFSLPRAAWYSIRRAWLVAKVRNVHATRHLLVCIVVVIVVAIALLLSLRVEFIPVVDPHSPWGDLLF